jgi:hypothetical protein
MAKNVLVFLLEIRFLGFHVTSGLNYKCFMIVIYNCNDSGQYYKTTIVVKAKEREGDKTVKHNIFYSFQSRKIL